MMKTNVIPALLCGSIICLSSCQNENMVPNEEPSLFMSVVAGIGNTPVTSRYAGTSPNSATFTQGDAIGIFVNEDPLVRWEYNGQKWNPEQTVYWTDKDTEHHFKAFYPYAEAASYNEIPMPSLKNQTGTMESVAACDFLMAEKSQSYGENGVVNFKEEGSAFNHISSLIQLTIKSGKDLASATLTSLSLTGANLVAPSTYSFTDGVKLTPDEESDEVSLALNYDMSEGDITYYLVVNEKLSATSTTTLTLQYTSGGNTYTATKEGLAGNVFQSGMMQSFTLSVQNLELLVTGSEISPWEQGNTMEDIVVDAKKEEA